MTLQQQVNLYPHQPKTTTVFLSARRALVALGVVSVLIAGVAVWASWQHSQLKAELTQLESKQTALQQEVDRMTASLGQRLPDPGLSQELDSLLELERLQGLVINEVKAVIPGQQVGFSDLLRGLSDVRVPGTWLETIAVDRTQDQVVLIGRIQSPELMPLYLDALQQQGVLAGIQFKGLQVESVDGEKAYRFTLSSQQEEEQ